LSREKKKKKKKKKKKNSGGIQPFIWENAIEEEDGWWGWPLSSGWQACKGRRGYFLACSCTPRWCITRWRTEKNA
jgi:hypothetical protein